MAVFAGPAVGGWLILHFGVVAAYASNVLGYGVYFVFVAFLRTPADYAQPPRSRKSFLGDLVDGSSDLRASRHRRLTGDDAAGRRAVVGDLSDGAGDRRQGVRLGRRRTVRAPVGGGHRRDGLGALARARRRRAQFAASLLLAFAGLAASVVGLALAWSLPAGVLAMVALGGANELCRTGSVTLLQTSIPDALRGRVMSTWFLLLRGAGAVGVVATGALAEGWGLRAPLLAGAGLAMLAGIVTYRQRARITRAFEQS